MGVSHKGGVLATTDWPRWHGVVCAKYVRNVTATTPWWGLADLKLRRLSNFSAL